MFIELAAAGFLAGQYIYHRWIEDKPVVKTKPQEVSIPRTDEGATVPLIIGRCRVKAPILVWHSAPYRNDGDISNGFPDGSFVYFMNMWFVLGIGMDDGNGTSRVHGMWGGEKRFSSWGDTGPETDILTELATASGVDIGPIGSHAMYFDGNTAQDPGVPPGGSMAPGYVGYISVFLDDAGNDWRAGSRPNIPQYSFEASSYHTEHPQLGTYARVGDDSNPINALYDLLVSKFGKLGLDESLIDIPNFQAAQYTLHTETHGYSRCIESASDAEAAIQEILRQIDAVLYFDESTQKIKIKLIRGDFDPSEIFEVNRYNAQRLTGFSMSGVTNAINKVRLIFTNRGQDTDSSSPDYLADYQDGSEVARNQALAIVNDGQVNEQTIHMPGVCRRNQARALAAREIAARSRSIMKFTIIGMRSMLRVNPGDAIKVVWSNPDINGVFRVAGVERGTLEDGRIAIHCISDYFYTYRDLFPVPPDFGSAGLDDLDIGP